MSDRADFPKNLETVLPLVTFALLTYNQEKYIEDALKAALSQTYPNIEIIISDDRSTDSTFDIIQKTIKQHQGVHTPIIIQNSRNLGLAAHINSVMNIAKGELIVVAAGDDVSFPHRVNTIVEHWLSTGKESGSIFSRFQTIDENGYITRHDTPGQIQKFSLSRRDLESTFSITNGTSGCSQAWTKDLFDIFGPLDPKILHEDITIPLRALLVGSVTYLPQELVLYRITSGSLSRASFSNYKDRFKKMSRYWEARVANYNQYYQDVTRLSDNHSLIAEDLKWLNRIIDSQLTTAAMNFEFFSGTFKEQVKTIFRYANKTSFKRRAKLMIIALIPAIYGLKIHGISRLNLLGKYKENKLN